MTAAADNALQMILAGGALALVSATLLFRAIENRWPWQRPQP
jgi:hypothetical protein